MLHWIRLFLISPTYAVTNPRATAACTNSSTGSCCLMMWMALPDITVRHLTYFQYDSQNVELVLEYNSMRFDCLYFFDAEVLTRLHTSQYGFLYNTTPTPEMIEEWRQAGLRTNQHSVELQCSLDRRPLIRNENGEEVERGGKHGYCARLRPGAFEARRRAGKMIHPVTEEEFATTTWYPTVPENVVANVVGAAQPQNANAAQHAPIYHADVTTDGTTACVD